MTDDDPIRWLREVCEAGTPGPWAWESEGYVTTPREDVATCTAALRDAHKDPPERDRDARLIAALGTLREPLLAAVEAVPRRCAEHVLGTDGQYRRCGQCAPCLKRSLEDAIRTHRGDDREALVPVSDLDSPCSCGHSAGEHAVAVHDHPDLGETWGRGACRMCRCALFSPRGDDRE